MEIAMGHYFIRIITSLFIIFFSLKVLAEPILITVKSNDKRVAAIGFKVNGKASGGLGKLYTGKGPKNEEYFFGYRSSIYGDDISCGSLKLNKNSTVVLVSQNKNCYCISKP
jgi:hypothetical protein